MSRSRIPIVATLIVLVAVGVMLRLGFWQLDRAAQKEALLARYAAASSTNADLAWPRDQAGREAAMFRRATITCTPAGPVRALAGHNAAGTTGWAQVQSCRLPDGGEAEAVLGWSPQPATVSWSGGVVRGVIGPGSGGVVRLVADPPLAGLQANAKPDPAAIPNNHLSYAVQWFLFALTALVIYGLALRKRLAAGGSGS